MKLPYYLAIALHAKHLSQLILARYSAYLVQIQMEYLPGLPLQRHIRLYRINSEDVRGQENFS